jgi:hypothetical protein
MGAELVSLASDVFTAVDESLIDGRDLILFGEAEVV